MFVVPGKGAVMFVVPGKGAVGGINLPLSTILIFDLGIVPTVRYFLFFILLWNISRVLAP